MASNRRGTVNVPIKSPIKRSTFQEILGLGIKKRRGKIKRDRRPEKIKGEIPFNPIFMTGKFAPQTKAIDKARQKCLKFIMEGSFINQCREHSDYKHK